MHNLKSTEENDCVRETQINFSRIEFILCAIDLLIMEQEHKAELFLCHRGEKIGTRTTEKKQTHKIVYLFLLTISAEVPPFSLTHSSDPNTHLLQYRTKYLQTNL